MSHLFFYYVFNTEYNDNYNVSAMNNSYICVRNINVSSTVVVRPIADSVVLPTRIVEVARFGAFRSPASVRRTCRAATFVS